MLNDAELKKLFMDLEMAKWIMQQEGIN